MGLNTIEFPWVQIGYLWGKKTLVIFLGGRGNSVEPLRGTAWQVFTESVKMQQ